MPTSTAPVLAPYTSPPPQHSLSLVTSVLGATSNWLVLRYLCDALAQVDAYDEEGTGMSARRGAGGRRKRRVVLVSFLRGWEFWRGEGRRIGLDLARLANEKGFVFVDGLSELFCPVSVAASNAPSSPGPGAPSAGRYPQPQRLPGALPVRSAPVRNGPSTRASGGSDWKKLRWSKKGGIEAVENDIVSVLEGLKNAGGAQGDTSTEDDVLLVIDQPDLLLTATGPGMGVGGTEVAEMIMGLRQHVHSAIVTCAADSPLVHNAMSHSGQQPTPLETEHAALVVGLAHQARMVLQLRELDTGVARDVSGVLRVGKGGAWETAREQKSDENAAWEEREVLFFVQGDGAVRVFGRGEA